MKKHLTLSQLSLTVVAGILLVITNINSIWSASIDLAHHYALAFRISENWGLVIANDPSLGEMSFYPRLTHELAAIAGLIFNSTFLGIQLVSLLALALLWGGVIYIYNTLSSRTAFFSSIGLMCLMILNRKSLHFEVHGAELIGNFFYSQLVAQGVVVFAIATAIYLEIKKCSNYTVAIFLIIITFIVTNMHLLPALVLLGVDLGVVGTIVLFSSKETGAQQIKLRVWYAGAAVLAVSSVFLSPAFNAFRKISENNGAISFTHLSSYAELILFCLSVLFVSGMLFNIWYRRRSEDNSYYIAVKYLGLYGASMALLCLAQIVALKLGFGSEYATKKYAFGLFTHLFISIPVLISLVSEKFPVGVSIEGLIKNKYLGTLLILLTYSIVFECSIPPTRMLAASDIVNIEHKLITLRDVGLPLSKEKSNIVIGLANMPATIDYMFSIAIMGTPVSLAIPDIMVTNKLNDFSHYKSILTSVNSKPYYFADCSDPFAAGSIAILNAACVKKELSQEGACVGNFDFTLKGTIDPSELSGFSIPEDHGRWTDGKNSKFSCTVQGRSPTQVRIDAMPFLYGSQKRQRFIVTIKRTVKVFDLKNIADGRNIEIALPASEIGEKLNIEFSMPDAISPKKVGFNADERQIGVSIKSISFK